MFGLLIGLQKGYVIEPDRTAGGLQVSVEDPHQVGFALSVPAKEAGDLSCPAFPGSDNNKILCFYRFR